VEVPEIKALLVQQEMKSCEQDLASANLWNI